MVKTVLIVGHCPDDSLVRVVHYTESQNIRLLSVDDPSGIVHTILGDGFAVFSFLPLESRDLSVLFSELPLGANEQYPVFQFAESEPNETVAQFPFTAFFTLPLYEHQLSNIFRLIAYQKKISAQFHGIQKEVIKYRKQKNQLLALSTALSSSNDLDKLLMLILKDSCDILRADAGSIYIRERLGPGKTFIDKLRFKVSINHSIDLENTDEFIVDINKKRISGYVADTGETVNIKDVYHIDSSKPYSFKDDFDEKLGYHVKSMLTVPLRNVGGVIVGVIQLMNKKDESFSLLDTQETIQKHVLDFSYADEEFLCSIASLAAVSIERAQLHESIEQIFEGFLSSSIAAIDERDQVTSGHSRRVMGYTLAFIDAVNRKHDGVFASVNFSSARKRQFKFAALLHDIGKIGVPERLLTKDHRLLAGELETICIRLELAKFQLKKDSNKTTYSSVGEAEKDWDFIRKINKQGYLSSQDYNFLTTIRPKWYTNFAGKKNPIISDYAWDALSVKKGNLTFKERELINSHAASSKRILSKIPWTSELEMIPNIASHHHERMNGTGYPDGISGENIPMESRILAVIDIYDALVTQDRPYKPALEISKAITILQKEVLAGHLDKDIVEFFIEEKIYSTFTDGG